MKQVKFSIVIPSKGRSHLIKETIESVLDQEYDDYELIVVDNNIDNETLNVIKKINNPIITIIKTGNLAMADNWMVGLKAAKGLYTLIHEDKLLLKKGALTYLDEVLKKYNAEVVTFEQDSFYDSESLFLNRSNSSKIESYLSADLKTLLENSEFEKFNKIAPRAVNTCFKTKNALDICDKIGPIFAPLSPDYVFCYHILNNVNHIIYLDSSINMSRYKSLDPFVAYGNGNSYWLKTELAKSFFNDHDHDLSIHYKNVPIKEMGIFNTLLSDYIEICKMYSLSNVKYDVRKYYICSYMEFSQRLSLGADVNNEMLRWKEAILNESIILRCKVYSSLISQYLKEIIYPFYRKAQRNLMIYKLLNILLQREKWRNKLIKYKNIKDCWDLTPVIKCNSIDNSTN
jgi:glycosyltransferase involved in cell wall biosynthesis